MPDLITYETIRAAHRAEKGEQLQSLPPGFFASVRNWLAIKSASRDTASLLEVENARRLLEEIVSLRERKLVLAALRAIRGSAPPQTMTESEQRFFEQLVGLLKDFRAAATEQLVSAIAVEETQTKTIEQPTIQPEAKVEPQPEPQAKVPAGNILIKVNIDLPRFVGPDMTAYGPLKAGDIILLPTELAEPLIARGVAQAVLEGA